MGSGVSKACVMRIKHTLIHVLSLCDLCEEEPESNHYQYSSPNAFRNVVPHLIV